MGLGLGLGGGLGVGVRVRVRARVGGWGLGARYRVGIKRLGSGWAECNGPHLPPRQSPQRGACVLSLRLRLGQNLLDLRAICRRRRAHAAAAAAAAHTAAHAADHAAAVAAADAAADAAAWGVVVVKGVVVLLA